MSARHTPAGLASPATPARPGRGLTAAVVLGGVLNPFNTSALAAALVTIGARLPATAAQLALIVSVVYVVSSVAQPLFGSLAARFGPRRMFVGGLLLVAAGGTLGGVATTPAGLVLARALLGLGSSSAYPSSMMLLQRAAARAPGGGTPTRQLGLLAASGNVMAAAGLPLGGLLVGALGWRAVFWVNLPLALLSLALTAVAVPRSLDRALGEGPAQSGHEGEAADASARPPRLDPLGILLFSTAILALAAALTGPATTRAAAAAVLLAAGLGTAGWELRVSRRGGAPFIDVALLGRSTALRRVYVRQFLIFGALYGMLYAGAQWLGAAQGLAAAVVGLAMLPQSLASALSSVAAGRTRHVRGLLLAAGAATVLGGLLALAAMAGGGVPLLSAAAGCLGLAMGLGGVGNQAALYLASPPAQLGVAAGLLRTSSYIGGFVMSAVMAAVYADGVTDAGFAVFGVLFLVCGTLLLGTSRTAPRSAPAA